MSFWKRFFGSPSTHHTHKRKQQPTDLRPILSPGIAPFLLQG